MRFGLVRPCPSALHLLRFLDISPQRERGFLRLIVTRTLATPRAGICLPITSRRRVLVSWCVADAPDGIRLHRAESYRRRD